VNASLDHVDVALPIDPGDASHVHRLVHHVVFGTLEGADLGVIGPDQMRKIAAFVAQQLKDRLRTRQTDPALAPVNAWVICDVHGYHFDCVASSRLGTIEAYFKRKFGDPLADKRSDSQTEQLWDMRSQRFKARAVEVEIAPVRKLR
jgi:hypothetical protein